MEEAALVLLQKQDSSFTRLVKETLRRTNGTRLVLKSSAPLPRVVYGAHGLVVWDVTGYEEAAMAKLLPELASDRVGVLLAVDHASPEMQGALEFVNPLGIIPPAQSAGALRFRLKLAWAHHRQAHESRGQLEVLRDELSDRLVVEKAKLLLMESLCYSEDEAMRRLQRYSRNSNQKMAKVAQQLLAGHEVFRWPEYTR
jgi:AmiR/NasT family two-component response regulator